MNDEEKNEEGKEESLDESSAKVLKMFLPGLMIIVFLVIGILIGLGTFYILNHWLKIFILRIFTSQEITTAFIITFSFFVTFLVLFILFYDKKFSKVFSILMIFSLLALIGDLILWAFSYGPLNRVGEGINLFFSTIFRKLDILFFYINPGRRLSDDFEEYEPKDYDKKDPYKGIEIAFSNPQYGSNSQPTAGRKYKLRVFLTNINPSIQDEILRKNIYDIKVKEVVALASPSSFQFEEDEQSYLYTTILTKEINLPPGETVPVVLEFQQLPSECQGRMYFKVIAKTTQTTSGKSEFMFLPDVSEQVRHSFKTDKSTPLGPIDVIPYVIPPNVIMEEDINDASVHITIYNQKDNVAIINKVRLLIQRDYVSVEKCEDDEFNELNNIISFCDSRDAAVCIDFNFINKIILKGKEAYSIECKLSFDKTKYDRAKEKSFIVAEVNYNYNYEEFFSISAKNCKARVTTTIGECRLPNICYKYSCPEGYEETTGTCGADSVCCAPISDLKCEDLVEDCPTRERALQKLACEARKAGIPPEIMIGIAMQESGGYHCKDGKVKSSDNGNSVGLMQVNINACPGLDVTNVNENIKCAISVFMNKCNNARSYATAQGFSCSEEGDSCKDYRLYCTYDCSMYTSDVEEGVKRYSGWDLAIRGYNGRGCCAGNDCYSDLARQVRNYVETVKELAATYGGKYV